MSIATMSHDGAWVLVFATTKLRSGVSMGTSRSRNETTSERFWAGEAWTENPSDALSFATQGDAIAYREENRNVMESSL